MRYDEFMIEKRLTHLEERYEALVTKSEFYAFRDELFTILDGIVQTLQRLDQERLVTHARLTHIEKSLSDSNSNE